MDDSSPITPSTFPPEAQDLVDRRTTQSMQSRVAIEKLVATLSTHLIQANSIEMADDLNWALQMIGEYAQVDRSYIHLVSDQDVVTQSFEWEDPDIPHPVGSLAGRNLAGLRWVSSLLKRGQMVYVPRMDDLPPEASEEKKTWQGLGLQSILACPFFLGQRYAGSFGFSSVRSEKFWTEADLRVLQLVSDILLSYIARKLAEDARRISEERYRAIAELTTDFTFAIRIEPEGQMVTEWKTNGLDQISGFTQAERSAAGGWQALVQPSDLPDIKVELQKLLTSHTPVTGEFRLVAKGGKIRWIKVFARPIWDATGTRVEHIIGALKDISEQKETQQALQQAQVELETRVLERTSELEAALQKLKKEAAERRALEEALGETQIRYRTLVETTPTSIIISDLKGDIIWANRHALEMHQFEMKELIGRNTFEMIVPEDRARAYENARTTLETGGVREIEYYAFRKDGSTFPAKLSASLITNNVGQPQAFMAVIWDITEFKRTQTELEHSERRYRLISELTSDNAYVIRVEKNKALMSEWFVDKVTRELGYSSDEMQAFGWMELLYPEDKDTALEHIGKVLQGKADDAEFRIIGKNGEVRWLHDYAQPVWDEGEQRTIRIYGAAQDITERRHAEEAYHTLVNQSLQGLAIFQRERVAFVNPIVESMIGYTVDEILQMRLPDLLRIFKVPENKDNFRKMVRAVVTNQVEPGRYEFGMFHKDGSLRWVEVQPMPAQFQEKPAVQAVFVDITERKRAEQAYWDLMEHSMQGILIIQDKRIVYVNPAIEMLTGFSRDYIIQTPLLDLRPRFLVGKIFAGLNDARQFPVRQGSSATGIREYQLRHSNGSIRWVTVQNMPTLFGGKPADQYIFLDITERVEAESALRDSEAAYRQQASELEALYNTSLKLNAQTEVKEVLQTILEQVVSLSRAVGGAIFMNKEGLTISVGVEDTLFNQDLLKAGGENLTLPMVNQQDTLGLLVIYKGRDAQGQPVGFSAQDQHIAELFAAQAALALDKARLLDETRLLYERERQQRRELEISQAQLVQAEKMAALGRLTSSIAHNIGNPLQAIQLSLELVREELSATHHTGQVERYIDIAASQIGSISRVLNQFRQFYRPQRKGEPVEQSFRSGDFYGGFLFQETSLPEVVRTVLELIQYRLKDCQVRQVIEQEEDLPPLLGVPDLLGQVVMNLAINTCDAIQTNGSSLPERTLTFRMKKDFLHQAGQAATERGVPAIRLEVSDDGPGLTPEIKNRVFEPFVSGKPEGSGLGLSSAYEIITAHQGTITVESTLGQGTNFTILLPLAPRDRPAASLQEMIA